MTYVNIKIPNPIPVKMELFEDTPHLVTGGRWSVRFKRHDTGDVVLTLHCQQVEPLAAEARGYFTAGDFQHIRLVQPMLGLAYPTS